MKTYSKHLTENQRIALQRAEAKLPTGYSYCVHDERDDLSTGAVWGVDVCREDRESIAHGQRNGTAYTTCDEARGAVRLMLNRAMAALWHKQPVWPRDLL